MAPIGKQQIVRLTKRFLNKRGYTISAYHPHFPTVLKRFGIETVLDIGANDGQFAAYIRSLIPTASIYSFEPLEDAFTGLQKRMAGDASFKAFNIALGEKAGSATIHRSSFSPSSSLLPFSAALKEIYPKAAGSTKETISVQRLDDVASRLSLKGGILIKIDVQGYEDRVIKGGRYTFAKASVVLVETSFLALYEGQPLFGDIHDLLVSLGFSYYGNNGQHFDKRNGNLLYEDSVFIRI